MKRTLNRMLTIAAVTVVAAGAALASEVNAKIPFNFSIGAATLPAGDYSIGKSGLGSGVLLLQDAKGHSAMVNPASKNEMDRERRARLVFRCGSNGCYLSQVWTGETGYSLFPPKHASDKNDDRIAVIYLSKPVAAE